MTSIEQLISVATDADLCQEVCDRLSDFYGGDVDTSSLPRAHRTVLLVWQSAGIIGNGGFNYLFETTCRGDPQYLLTASSFHTIQCDEAAKAFQNAMNLFPGSTPPEDVGERLHMYRRGKGALRHDIDSAFWKAQDAIDHKLAEFIRAHVDDFTILNDPSAKQRQRHVTIPPREPDETDYAIQQLPHWARVAFAARAARLALPAFDASWPDASDERRQTLVMAVSLAEDSAARGRRNEEVDNALTNAAVTCGAALRSLYGFPGNDNGTGPTDGNAGVVASDAAKAAAKAAETANVAPARSRMPASEAFLYACRATSHDEAIVKPLLELLNELRRLAKSKNWTDDTPIPARLLSHRDAAGDKYRPWWRSWQNALRRPWCRRQRRE